MSEINVNELATTFGIEESSVGSLIHDICVPRVTHEKWLDKQVSIPLSSLCARPACRGVVAEDDVASCSTNLCCVSVTPNAYCTAVIVEVKYDVVLETTNGDHVILSKSTSFKVDTVKESLYGPPVPVGDLFNIIDGACVTIKELGCMIVGTPGEREVVIDIDVLLKLWKHDNIYIFGYVRHPDDITVTDPFNEILPCPPSYEPA